MSKHKTVFSLTKAINKSQVCVLALATLFVVAKASTITVDGTADTTADGTADTTAVFDDLFNLMIIIAFNSSNSSILISI